MNRQREIDDILSGRTKPGLGLDVWIGALNAVIISIGIAALVWLVW